MFLIGLNPKITKKAKLFRIKKNLHVIHQEVLIAFESVEVVVRSFFDDDHLFPSGECVEQSARM